MCWIANFEKSPKVLTEFRFSSYALFSVFPNVPYSPFITYKNAFPNS